MSAAEDRCDVCGAPIVKRDNTWSHVDPGDDQSPYLHGPFKAGDR